MINKESKNFSPLILMQGVVCMKKLMVSLLLSGATTMLLASGSTNGVGGAFVQVNKSIQSTKLVEACVQYTGKNPPLT